MFGLFGKKPVCKNVELYNQIQNDGIDYAGSRFAAVMIDNWLTDYDLAYDFVMQELDGASLGNDLARNFVRESGISPLQYRGALSIEAASEVESASNFLMQLSSELQPKKDMIIELRLSIVKNIMAFYEIGNHDNGRQLFQDGLLDSLDALSLLGFVEPDKIFSFQKIDNDLDIISESLPKNFNNVLPYNSLMPLLYAKRFVYAGLFNQGKIDWREFNEFENNHFRAVMIRIGDRLTKSEQIYFQEESNNKSIELLQAYSKAINKNVIKNMILSAKNNVSLIDIMENDIFITSHMCLAYYSKYDFLASDGKEKMLMQFSEVLNTL